MIDLDTITLATRVVVLKVGYRAPLGSPLWARRNSYNKLSTLIPPQLPFSLPQRKKKKKKNRQPSNEAAFLRLLNSPWQDSAS